MIVGGGRRARRELRGKGVRRPHGDGRTAGAPAVPAASWSRPADVGVHGGEQGGVRGLRARRRRSSRGCRSTRPSSTCGGLRARSRGPRPTSRRGFAARSASGSACRSRSASPAPSSSPRSRAAWRSPTGCSSSRRRRARLPAPAAGRAALGRRAGHRGEAARARASRPSARSPGSREAALVVDPRPGGGAPPPRPRPQPRPPARSRSAGGAARSGSQRALGRAPRSADDLDADLVGLVDRLTRRLRAARRVGRTVTLRLRFDDFSRATRSHTMPEATAQTPAILATARGLVAAATPMIERRGITLVGVALGNLGDDDAIQLALPFERVRRRASMRPWTTSAIATGRRRHPRRAPGPRPGRWPRRFCPISPRRGGSQAPPRGLEEGAVAGPLGELLHRY